MSINLTDEIEVKTKKGKLGAAEQIFLKGDTKTVEKEIQDINSRHNDLSSKHESLSSTVSEHTNQIESNQSQITANKSAQDEKNTSLDANIANLNTRDDQITETLNNITVTGGASVASAVTYNNSTSNIVSVNVQGAIDELQGTKIDKTSILQESGDAEDKVMSQKATTAAIAEEVARAKAAEEAIIFDVSANNNGAVFESLSALLNSSDLSTLIPISVRHGGMIIRFIQGSEQSSDNKYVQYRLMTTYFSSTESDWQGVDDVSTAGSDNLVKSGGAFHDLLDIKTKLKEYSVLEQVQIIQNDGELSAYINNGKIMASNNSKVVYYRVINGQEYKISANFTYSNIATATAVGFLAQDSVPQINQVCEVVHAFNVTGKYVNNYLPQQSGWILICIKISGSTTGTDIKLESLKAVDFQAEIDNISETVTTQQAVLDDISNLYTEKEEIQSGGTIDGQIVLPSGKFFESSNYHNLYYRVSALKKINISINITRDLPTVAAITFFSGDSLPIAGSIGNVLQALTAGEVNIEFTPSSDGYLLIINNIKDTVYVNNISILSQGNYVDFQSEIDTLHNKVDSNVLTQNTVLTDKSNDNQGYIWAYINSTTGAINAQSESSGRKVRYYKAVIGEKWRVTGTLGTASSFTFIGFLPGKNTPASGDIAQVIQAYPPSGTYYISKDLSITQEGWILIGFNSSAIENRHLGLDWRVYRNEEIKLLRSLYLPNSITGVVGDTLQVFTKSLVKDILTSKWDLLIQCEVGTSYPRYYQINPVATDIGTHNISIYLKNYAGQLVDKKVCELVIKSAPTNPSSMKRIAVFGDSLTQGGQWVTETVRRLLSSDGATPTMPAGNGLTNVKFIGAMGSDNAKYYGVGGWGWSNYATEGKPAFRFQVTGVTTVVKGTKYTNNGFEYIIQENNTTEGVGNILCSTSASTNVPQASGNLTKVSGSGSGDDTITFTSVAADVTNPLWNGTKVSFIKYLSDINEPSVDCAMFLLGWNEISAGKDVIESYIHTILDSLHTEFPNAVCKLIGLQLPSLNGGLGANYGASGIYSDKVSLIKMVYEYNEFLMGIAASDTYSSFVEYVDVASQFDSENNMPETEVQVNTRNAKTEYLGTNGVHPATSGYYQIADVMWRNIVKTFC